MLGNQNWPDDLAEQMASVGFESADDISLHAIQQAPDTLQVSKIEINGPRLGLTLGFDPIAQLTQTTLELLDRPL